MVIAAHFVLCGLPLLLDVLVGPPDYLKLRGFFLSESDPVTFLIFAAYVAVCPVFWFALGCPCNPARGRPSSFDPRVRRIVRVLSYPTAISPGLVALLAPSPDAYLGYAVPITGALSLDAIDWHHWVATFSVLAVVASAFLLSEYRVLTAARVAFLTATMTASCWLNGKRVIVAIALSLVGYALWSQGVFRGRRLQVALALGALALLTFSLSYQHSVRHADVLGDWSGGQTAYDGTRVDFFRDDRIRLTLFSELHPDQMQILDHRGQSFLFYLTFPVPRDAWPAKPWPYATYFTSAALGLYPARPLGWGMTTSWLEEVVANCGWFGLLLAPMTLVALCRFGDAIPWTAMRMLTALLAVLLLTVEPIAFMPLFLLWIALYAAARFLAVPQVP